MNGQCPAPFRALLAGRSIGRVGAKRPSPIPIALLWLCSLSGWAASAASVSETFDSEPGARGWAVFGDATLFQWSAAGQNLEVTWDSSRTNSFFFLPLQTILTMGDDFSFGFDLRVRDIHVGSTPGKSNEFQIAVGLINYTSATQSNAFRGTGQNPTYGVKNLVEFDYFPDAGFGDTWASTVVSTNNRIFPVHNFPLTLTMGDTFRILISYTSSDQVLRTRATRNGEPFGLGPGHVLADLPLTGRPDFRVDTFAVISYSDAIQAGPLAVHGSILAHGTFDNLNLTLPPLPVRNLQLSRQASGWQVAFDGATNWVYRLERTLDFREWLLLEAAPVFSGNRVTLLDSDPPAASAYYRVQAKRP